MNYHRVGLGIGSLFVVAAMGLAFAAEKPAASSKGAAKPGEKPPKQRPVDDKMIADLEAQARKCETAREALDLYIAFQQHNTELTPRQTATLAERQKVWKQRVDDGLVRLGLKWVTLAEAKVYTKKAESLIDQAFQKIDEEDYKRAKELFDKAIAADPQGIRAGYLMGILNSPNFSDWPLGAEKYFEIVVRREPKHVGLLNNLALSEVRVGKHNAALDHWATALRLTESSSELTQNLGRFISESKDRKLKTTESQLKRARVMYARAIDDKKGKPVDPKHGWLYSPIVLSKTERQRSTPEKSDQKVCVGSGTGFVIHPQFILTNRHVAADSEALSIVDPKQPESEFEATVVAISKDHDLAILRCDKLVAPAVTLHPDLLQRSSEVMVLGYPLTDVLGSGLKSVRGAVFGLRENDSMVLYQAATNPGNSGGPVCDSTGTVVAVHFAGIDLSAIEHSDGKLGCGIPTPAAIPFVKQHVPEVAPKKQDAVLSWPEVDAKVSQSTVLIKIFQSAVAVTAKRRKDSADSAFEDRTCSACRARARIPCPASGCASGAMAAEEITQRIESVGYLKEVVTESRIKTVACRTCDGTGYVDCMHCFTGMDPTLTRKPSKTSEP